MTKQTGVAMIFSLIMLLLITLVGVSAVQQNKMQFLMAGNSRAQTEALTNAENILKLAELKVKTDRQGDEDPDSEHCYVNSAGEFTPLYTENTAQPVAISLGISNAAATIEDCQALRSGASITEVCTNTHEPGTELYTIRVRFIDDGGAVRTVESLFAINCTESLSSP